MNPQKTDQSRILRFFSTPSQRCVRHVITARPCKIIRLPKSAPISWPLLYLAVSLTTLGTLLLELSLTRIFSVVFYYHFAFLAISIALFGLGAGGVFSYVVAAWRGAFFRKLGWLSAVNSVLVVLAIAILLGQGQTSGSGSLTLIYFTTALPFFGAGAIISLVISETIERVNRVYFFDLLGAAGGCLLLIPLLNLLGGPNTAISVAILFAAASSIWFFLDGFTPGRVAAVGLGLLLTLLVVVNVKSHWIEVRYAKGQKLHDERFVKWNSFSRIALAPDHGSGAPTIYIDADASTGIANFDFDHLSSSQRHDLLEQGPALAYAVRPGAKTLIIGPGGGWDVARALASGSRDITGAEINPIIATTIMRQKFPELSRNLYFHPGVKIVVADGRSYVRQSSDQYQVLQATLVDTWASTAAGAFALSESSLYTTDAMRDYLARLTPDGLLSFTRWGFEPPRESLRLIALAIAALRDLGESAPATHVIVGREGTRGDLAGWGARDTVLISRQPFTAADIERARSMMTAAHMTAVYLPGAAVPNQFTALLTAPDPLAYERGYPFDISPIGDDRPFFFYTVQPRDVWAFIAAGPQGTADYKINKAVPLLFEALGVSLMAVLVVLLLPPLVLGAKVPHEPSLLLYLLYFLCIGAGYILVEVALIQKFVLFLGHPTYALTVVVFSLLLSSSLGSSFSRRALDGRTSRLLASLGGVTLLVAVLACLLLLLSRGVGLPLPAKMLITVALIFPAGFVMGMPFPAGLARLEGWRPESLRWAWSLNAAASVLGSVGALVCAIYMGLTLTMLMGGVLYVVALLIVARVGNRLSPPRGMAA